VSFNDFDNYDYDFNNNKGVVMSFVSTFAGFVFWFLITILIHELGHSIMAEKLGYKAKIKGFSTYVYPTPSKKDDFKILLAGWISGFVFVMVYVLSSPEWLGVLMLGLYVLGTGTDLKQIFTGDFTK
jgi:Zn-dependent protease